MNSKKIGIDQIYASGGCAVKTPYIRFIDPSSVLLHKYYTLLTKI